MLLSPEWKTSFWRDGYGTVTEVVDPGELKRLSEVFADLFERRVGYDTGDQFDMAARDDSGPRRLPQLLYPSHHVPELSELGVRGVAETIADELLGPDARLDFDHAILKPPRTGAETAWHQDEAYWDSAYDHAAVSVWVPLDDVTVDNGCLYFIPGSHQSGIREHHSVRDDPRVHAFEIRDVDPAAAVACPLSVGSLSVHHCRTIHFAGANVTDRSRLAYVLVLGRPRRAREDRRSFRWQQARKTAAHERRGAAARTD